MILKDANGNIIPEGSMAYINAMQQLQYPDENSLPAGTSTRDSIKALNDTYDSNLNPIANPDTSGFWGKTGTGLSNLLGAMGGSVTSSLDAANPATPTPSKTVVNTSNPGGLGRGMFGTDLVSGILQAGMGLYNTYMSQKQQKQIAEQASAQGTAQHLWDVQKEGDWMNIQRAQMANSASIAAGNQKQEAGRTLQGAYAAYLQMIANAQKNTNDAYDSLATHAEAPLIARANRL